MRNLEQVKRGSLWAPESNRSASVKCFALESRFFKIWIKNFFVSHFSFCIPISFSPKSIKDIFALNWRFRVKISISWILNFVSTSFEIAKNRQKKWSRTKGCRRVGWAGQAGLAGPDQVLFSTVRVQLTATIGCNKSSKSWLQFCQINAGFLNFDCPTN